MEGEYHILKKDQITHWGTFTFLFDSMESGWFLAQYQWVTGGCDPVSSSEPHYVPNTKNAVMLDLYSKCFHKSLAIKKIKILCYMLFFSVLIVNYYSITIVLIVKMTIKRLKRPFYNKKHVLIYFSWILTHCIYILYYFNKHSFSCLL